MRVSCYPDSYSKRRHKRRSPMLHGAVAGLLIISMLALPIMGERFSANIIQFTGAATSSFATSPYALFHRITWLPATGVAACTSIALDVSSDGSAWTNVIAPVSCLTRGFATSTANSARYYRITVVGLAGGNLLASYAGYDTDPTSAGGPSTVTVGNTVTAQVSGTVNVGNLPSTQPVSGTVNVGNPVSSVSVTSGTIGQITMPALTVTSSTVGQMPALSFTSGTVGSMPSVSMTSGTIGAITMPSLTFTSGTVTNTVAMHETAQVTQVSATSATVGSMPALTVTSGTVTSNQGTAANATAGWPITAGVVTATVAALTSASALDTTIGVTTKGYASAVVALDISGSITLGTYIYEGSSDGGATYKLSVPCARADVTPAAPVMTMSVNSPTQWLVCRMGGLTNFRARLNPAITNTGTGNITIQASNQPYDPYVYAIAVLQPGGNTVGAVKNMVISATDTTASTAQGNDVRAMGDKWGRQVIVFTPDDMNGTTNYTLTATTASAVQAAVDANHKWAIDGWHGCITTATVATRIDLLFGTTIKDSFPFPGTTTAGGGPYCYDRNFVPPLLAPANTAVNVQTLTALSSASGVVDMHKTGT